MKNKNENVPAIVKSAMLILSNWCELHPTCKGCNFGKKHIGCQFRGKSPREYKNIKN